MTTLVSKGVMSRIAILTMVGATLAVAAPQASALSRGLEQPDIFFPKAYNQKKAASILNVLQDKQFKYVSGLTSFWPARGPQSLAYPTFLYYDGETASLEKFVAALVKLQGVHLQVSFSRKVENGSWEVIYSHTNPDTLSVVVNLKAKQIDLEELHLPEWEKSPQ